MDAILRIRTKDGGEILKKEIEVVSKKKPKTKTKTKVPKGVSSTKKNGEFAKFTPLKTPSIAIPDAWDDENTDDLASAINLDDDGKFETENDIYIKQDQEWHELMKEVDKINNDDATSEVPDEDTLSENNFDDDGSDVSNNDDDMSDASNIDSELEDGDIFYRYAAKEPKASTRPAKIYSGIPIDFDDSD